MDLTRRRLEDAQQALATLLEVSSLSEPSEIERDAAIQRFEYTFETVWKSAQALLAREGIEANSPRMAVRRSRQVGLLSDSQAESAMRAIADRNLTSHTYKRALAEEVYKRLSSHAQLFEDWLTALNKAYSSE